MGNPAKSAKLQLVEGNPAKKNIETLKKRVANEEKLHGNTDKIRAPKWLDSDGKRAFTFLKKHLLEVELVTNLDVFTLALYCDAMSEYMKYTYKMKADDYISVENRTKTIFNDDGDIVSSEVVSYDVPHAFAGKLDKVAVRIRQFSADLGLSPAARAKLAIKMTEAEIGEEDDY